MGIFTERLNPKDAWDVARHRVQGGSNLARCYVEAVEVLKKIEWVIGRDECPCCIRTEEQGHAKACRLAAIIRPIVEAP